MIDSERGIYSQGERVMNPKSKVTDLLIDIRQTGVDNAREKIFPLIYEELKRLAYSKLEKEKNISLTATALVHELYLKMIDQTKIQAKDKNHFMAIAARCMRQILVDHARKKKAEKRGGNQEDVTYVDQLLKVHQESKDIIELDDKLKKLSKLDQRMADVVTLRFFGQMTVEATADTLDISKRTVKRDWAKARGWLYKELRKN